MAKDYYKILDIAENSSAEEIKSAYRKLARKWHPDIAGSDPIVLERFKDINEAYELLSNKLKKTEYDRARRFYSYANGTTKKEETRKESQDTKNNRFENKINKNKFEFHWQDFIKNTYHNSYSNKKNSVPEKGKDIYSDVEISVFEAISGTTKVVNMLHTEVCPKCNGHKFVNYGTCPHCKGKGDVSTYKRFCVKIPSGIKDKSKIRLAGEGEKGVNGGANGDLYLTIHIQQTKNYKVDGLNILKTIAITPFEAVLGTEFEVATLRGNANVKITPNTQNGQRIKVSGGGIVQNEKVGDMIITVEIRIPENISDEEIKLYEKLKEISSETVRKGL